MPYIKKEDRSRFDSIINIAVKELKNGYSPSCWPPRQVFLKGELNYFISKIIWSLFETNQGYEMGSSIRGVLHDVDAEFYRRKMAPYEDKKMQENGDL